MTGYPESSRSRISYRRVRSGLIAAIDRYDASQGVKLRTYAEFKIRGAILDSLRELDWAPRTQRQRARKLLAAAAEAESRLGTTAGVEDIAQEIGITLQECQSWMRDTLELVDGSTRPGR